MVWYKKEISHYLSSFPSPPYCYWIPTLFENVHPEMVVVDNFGEKMKIVASIIESWERFMGKAADAAGGTEKWIHSQEQKLMLLGCLVSGMYSCLLFPRDEIIIELKNSLPDDSEEQRLCASLADSESDYRHIRNALAHGTFEPSNTSDGFRFIDRNWNKTKSLGEIRLLTSI